MIVSSTAPIIEMKIAVTGYTSPGSSGDHSRGHVLKKLLAALADITGVDVIEINYPTDSTQQEPSTSLADEGGDR